MGLAWLIKQVFLQKNIRKVSGKENICFPNEYIQEEIDIFSLNHSKHLMLSVDYDLDILYNELLKLIMSKFISFKSQTDTDIFLLFAV